MAITEVLTDRAGQVAALNAGTALVRCDIIAITDDDAAPRPDWISGLITHFGDPRVAAVGGRDVVHGAVERRHQVVGRVAWHGRITGNHHRGIGPARTVDLLKGANMAFRTEWLRRFGFDERLRGAGAQVHNDLRLCLEIRRAGGRLVYDPAVVVDHYPAARPAGDGRMPATMAALEDEVHNETLALLDFLPPLRRAAWVLWVVLLGTRRRPGLGVSVWLLPRGRWSAVRTLAACWRGAMAGAASWRAARGTA